MVYTYTIEHYRDLPEKDRMDLLKFPAYISLLACLRESGMDAKEKKSAIRLTHVKTFMAPLLLRDFYKETENNFEEDLVSLNNELPKDPVQREYAIHKELGKLEVILRKLGQHYAAALHESLKSYTRYVSHAHNNVLEYFIFPMPIKGLTD